jgi:hypothetical protein
METGESEVVACDPIGWGSNPTPEAKGRRLEAKKDMRGHKTND